MTINNLAKIRRAGLNAFGQPYTGNAIRHTGRRVGLNPFGGGKPSMQGPRRMGEEAMQMESAEAEARDMADAVKRGQDRARAEANPLPQAPEKPKGKLVYGAGGSMKWQTGDAPAAASRPTAPTGGGMLGDVMRSVGTGLAAARRWKGQQDRQKSRTRYAAEKAA